MLMTDWQYLMAKKQGEKAFATIKQEDGENKPTVSNLCMHMLPLS